MPNPMIETWAIKPFTIDLVRCPRRADECEIVARWCGGRSDATELQTFAGVTRIRDFGGIQVPTLDGVVTAEPGDGILRNDRGQFTVVPADVLTKMYERVDQETNSDE